MNASYLTNENNLLVCVVDDELSIRESLSRLLRSAELNVQTLCSAQEFLISPPLAPIFHNAKLTVGSVFANCWTGSYLRWLRGGVCL